MSNGHQLPAGIQIPGLPGQQQSQQAEQAKSLVMQRIREIAESIYERAAAQEVMHGENPIRIDRLEHMARSSYAAAQAYFSGLGVLKYDEDETDQ